MNLETLAEKHGSFIYDLGYHFTLPQLRELIKDVCGLPLFIRQYTDGEGNFVDTPLYAINLEEL